MKKFDSYFESIKEGLYDAILMAEEDLIPGGLSDGSPPEDFDQEQLKAGIKVEMEHTDDPKIAREIAMDHLTEDPQYYVKLDKMENEKLNESTYEPATKEDLKALIAEERELQKLIKQLDKFEQQVYSIQKPIGKLVRNHAPLSWTGGQHLEEIEAAANSLSDVYDEVGTVKENLKNNLYDVQDKITELKEI
jgi:uncharacterized membrane-anchored protein YjiN (DUF445 family)